MNETSNKSDLMHGPRYQVYFSWPRRSHFEMLTPEKEDPLYK